MNDVRTVEVDLNDLIARGGGGIDEDEDPFGVSPRRRRRGEAAEERAEKQRVAQEQRDLARRRRQEELARKKAERTQSQVRAQAIKFGRKFRDTAAAAAPKRAFSNMAIVDDDDDGDAAARLELGPIAQQPNGDLVVVTANSTAAAAHIGDIHCGGGGGGGGGGARTSQFEHSLQTLHELVTAPPDAPGGRKRGSGGAVTDITGNAQVLHRNPAIVTSGGGGGGLPGIPTAAAAAAAAAYNIGTPDDTTSASGLPGVAIGGRHGPAAAAAAVRINDATTPLRFGALRGGALPTYREYVQQQQQQQLGGGGSGDSTLAAAGNKKRSRQPFQIGLSEEQRVEQARLEKELQDLAIAKQYEHLTRLYNSLPELRRQGAMPQSGGGGGASTTQRRPPMRVRSVPQQRRTVRRVYRVGRTDSELSMLTHSTTTRASVDDFRLHMQSLSTEKMRRALLAAKLLHAGSEAPEPLVRRIFHQRQLLVGDLEVSSTRPNK